MQDFYPFCETSIFFNSSVSEQEKEDIKSLFMETCRRIEGINPSDIINVLGNIEFIIYKTIEGDNAGDVDRSPDGGVTLRSCWRLLVIYYPLKRFTERETMLYILAHEFAHVFCQHPFRNLPSSLSEKLELEYEADTKAVEWGFKPHDSDIGHFPNFSKRFN